MTGQPCGASYEAVLPWLTDPIVCDKPKGHRGYHRCDLGGVAYDWPSGSAEVSGADQPRSA